MKSQQSPQRSSNNRSNTLPQSDEDDSESDDVVYQRGAVLNLLDIGNSSRWKEDGRISLSNLGGGMNLSQLAQASSTFTDRGERNGLSGSQLHDGSVDNSDRAGEMSITKVFEPKFMEVFNKYLESASKAPDLSKHLLSVCLENLIEFSCWSRENASQSHWIRSTLDENSDLRPEVRNGLAMILIYVFSSAQASQQNSEEITMFTVLQDAEKGMGIVNKTSLKIYNDPFNYFNFLKSCISGLIDAGKIPENERQNQPKKPKRVNENKEELAAYEHLQQAVVKWIDEGDHVLVRSKIGQIMDVWQQKQKGIRNRRFAVALQLIATPATISTNPTFVPGNVGAVFSPRLYDASTSNGGFDMNGAGTNPLTSLAAIADIYDGDKRTSALTAANALLASAGLDAASLAKAGNPNVAQALSNGAASNLNMLSLDPSLLSNPTLLAAAHLVQQHQQQQQQQQQKMSAATPSASSVSRINDQNNGNDSRSFQPPAKYARTNANSSAGAAHSMNQLSSASQDGNELYRSKSTSVVNNTTHPITVLRFERVSGRDWDYQELKVYNVDALLEHHHGPLWFIDETKLSREECQLKHLQTQTHGMVSLSQELQQRQALVSSWLPKDHAHLTDFVSAWLQDQQRVGSGDSRDDSNKASEPESMLQFWRRQSMQQNGERSTEEAEAAAAGKGILAYEVVLQVGFVVRKDEALGIHEDCWRLVYPQELQQRLQQHQSSSFAQFLASLFPQLRSVLLQKRSDDDLAGTIVKYFPHHLEHPVQHPPKRDHQQGAETTYQTIGTLAESVETIFTQFETSFVAFHDIVLQGT